MELSIDLCHCPYSGVLSQASRTRQQESSSLRHLRLDKAKQDKYQRYRDALLRE